MNRLFTTTLAGALILAAGSAAFAGDRDDADRTVIATYEYADFDRINVEGVFELDIQPGDRFSIRTEATPEQARRMRVSQSGDRLTLDLENDKRWSRNENGAVLAVITMPQLRELDITGVAMGEVSAFRNGRVDIDVAGVGNIELSGRCDTLDIDVAGVGEIDAEDLVCDRVNADMGGVGELSVHAADSIEADIGGVGEIVVYGNPATRRVSDGFLSKVSFK